MAKTSLTNVKKMKTSEMIILTTSLAYMSQAGLTLRNGVEIIMADPDSKISKGGLGILLAGFDEGMMLSEIIKENEKVFGRGLREQIAAAERTGKVSACLLRLADQFKNGQDVVSKVRSAMMYPVFILVVALIAALYLFTNTVPEMAEMMQEFGADLPPLTQAVMGFSDMLINYGIAMAIGVVGLVLLIRWACSGPMKLQYHHFILKFALSGGISTNMNYSIVYTLINDMIENGAAIVEALRVAAASSRNIYIMKEIMDCADTMEREGFGLAEALQNAKTMPSDDRLMLNVGSQTGREMEILRDLAVRRNAAARDAVASVLELMTPIIMLFVCGLVGILVVSVYMPMLTMASSMR